MRNRHGSSASPDLHGGGCLRVPRLLVHRRRSRNAVDKPSQSKGLHRPDRVPGRRIDSEGDVAVVQVAGRLTGAATKELKDVCKSIKGNFVLDLSKLMFADDAGVEVIRTLRKKGAEISGASSFIRSLISDDSGYK